MGGEGFAGECLARSRSGKRAFHRAKYNIIKHAKLCEIIRDNLFEFPTRAGMKGMMRVFSALGFRRSA